MPVFQEEDGHAEKEIRVHGIGPIERAVTGKRQQERVLPQLRRRQAAVLERQREKQEIEATAVQGGKESVGPLLTQMDTEAGKLGSKDRQDPREEVRGDRGDHAEPQEAGERAARAAASCDEVVYVAQDDSRSFDRLGAGAREEHLPRRPLEQAGAEPSLELADLGAQARLTDAAGLRSPAEVTVLLERDEILQLLERGPFHHHRLSDLFKPVSGLMTIRSSD